jgi:hypothetical protein
MAEDPEQKLELEIPPALVEHIKEERRKIEEARKLIDWANSATLSARRPMPKKPAKAPSKTEQARQLIREIIPGGGEGLTTETVRQMLCVEHEKHGGVKDYFKYDVTERALDRDKRKPRKRKPH